MFLQAQLPGGGEMAHRSNWIWLGVLICVATTLSPAATITTEDARIDEVTVYRDRAEVTRKVTVEVPAGASTVEFAGIPSGVESDSLRIRAEGVPAMLGAVEIVESVGKRVKTPEYIAAYDEVLRLERQIAEVAAEGKVDGQLLSFLNLRSSGGEAGFTVHGGDRAQRSVSEAARGS
jgi:hypothetical protein